MIHFKELSIAICLTGLLVMGSFEYTPAQSDIEEEGISTCLKRQKVIEKELAKSKVKSWAGEYEAFMTLFSVAPEAGFVFFRDTDNMTSSCVWGKVNWSNDKLTLIPDISNSTGSIRGIDIEWVPVTWGDRHYIIPTQDLLDFVNSVNNGYEPSFPIPGFGSVFFMLKGDDNRKINGFPTLPLHYGEFLLSKPIRGKVTTVGDFHIETEDNGRVQIRVTKIILNVGAKSGVKVGMNFVTYKPIRVHEDVVITNVYDDSSEAITRQRGPIFDLPSIKWKVSTSIRDIK